MGALLWLVVLLPFAGFVVLTLFGRSFPKRTSGIIGCSAVGLSWVCAMVVAGSFLLRDPAGAIDAPLYSWIAAGGLSIDMRLRLDPLSLVMMSVVTFVAFLIHLYSAESMYEEEGYSRFFSYMNLFVASMLVLVLAGNLVPLYLGWEGVGLCSYLLIGFWYRETKNGLAAQKAFIVTRVGDAALALGLFLLYRELGTLNIQDALRLAPEALAAGGALATAVAFLILTGAVGKSAQVPLQVWLPDAMAGPTPVSALIHAATMVTAGVYLLARLHVLFLLAPTAMAATAAIGTVTLLLAGCSALVQSDIKRVLAYSTISQLGYMFVALGVGTWSGAVFHFLTHAFFKSLLFLSAGAASDALHHELNMFRMGGLWGRLKVPSVTFLIGAASLAALPLVTAGFYSKDAILWASYVSGLSSAWLWVGALLGSLLTGAYSARAFLLAFLGPPRTEISRHPGRLVKGVLIVLAFFSLVSGFLWMPETLGGFAPFRDFLAVVLPALEESPGRATHAAEAGLLLLSSALTVTGIGLAYVSQRYPQLSDAFARSGAIRTLHRLFLAGWGFDWLYQTLIVRPLKRLILADKDDVVDGLFTGLGETGRYAGEALSTTQTGRLRGYAAGVVLGAVLVAAIALLRG